MTPRSLLRALALGVCAHAACAISYRAAVVQHVLYPLPSGAPPAAAIAPNLAKYANATATAAGSGAQIIVFPEFGLGMPTDSCTSNTAASPFCEPVPFAMGDVACGSGYPIQSNASCWARRYGIVVAINSCEAAAEGNYNVELVYNATGALVAKYRKVHPWYTKCFVTPATPDYIVAPLPFGNFGIFTCFDIMWPTPGPVLVNQYGIRHFIYSAAIPLIGSAAEALWSDVHGSLLLSSNLMDGQSGVFVNGTRLTPVPASGQDVIMFANISA